jgi:hypothetical protein
MELDGDTIIWENVVVVAFDMCSSSNIIEDLGRTESLGNLDQLLKELHNWLRKNSTNNHFAIYKFTGDGWILLFLGNRIDPDSFLKFLVSLSEEYQSLLKKHIEPYLESVPENRGLTFGIETGHLRKIKLGDKIEFVGRALNVACRLQNAVRDSSSPADYKVLLSRRVFYKYLAPIANDTTLKFYNATRNLRNISGGERYRCKKFNLSKLMAQVNYAT